IICKLYSIERGEKMTTPVFELKNIDYYLENKKVLENINININKGQYLAIVGPNGTGNSTLIKIIFGLLPFHNGEVLVDGKIYNGKQSLYKISYVSKKAQAFKAGFSASVKDVVMSGLTKRKKLFQWFNKKDENKVEAVLNRLNIGH